ncbi:peptidoglycan-binding protein [Anaerococcus urinomassiliensis]|uniref:peptidoglycan-binding protein n=1 Tax=Anaerococcus urinomassiliensis TaxID=1745712 RepID=UPI00093E5124|nr:peptidoglycan-binding protein [Anaerococcus urinomassiliensis]
MKKKYSIATIMLATALTFAGCANNNEEKPANEVKEEQATEETTEAESPAVEEEATKEEATEEENTEEEAADENSEEASEEDTKETSEETPAEMGNLVLHRAYPKDVDRSFTNVVVATSGDKIVDAIIDEYQYYEADSDYKGVPNSDGAFGEGTAEGKILGSKIDNNEAYSADMKEAGGEVTLLDNYNAVTDFVKGKTIAELEDFLNENDDEQILDAITGATFKSTPNLLKMIVETAKDNTFVASGDAENPDDVEIRYALGAPHGDKSFGNAVVAVEGDKIIAASIDEYQYLEGGAGVPGSEGGFSEGYNDSNVVLGSKLENNDMYSDLMTEHAQSTVALKDNYAAIENFVAGKTVEEVKSVIESTTPGKAIDEVTGATLVDTAGYLQLIIDAVENNIRN